MAKYRVLIKCLACGKRALVECKTKSVARRLRRGTMLCPECHAIAKEELFDDLPPNLLPDLVKQDNETN